MSSHILKVAVTGAAGQIGYALLFRLASGEVFGRDVKIDLHLIEISSQLPALEGIKMELDDCAFKNLNRVMITDTLSDGFAAIDWAILVGASPRGPGMERADLLAANAKIFKTQGQALNQYAKRSVKVFVVGNPCNTNAMITRVHAPDINPKQFYAMTLLDENRARSQLAQKARVPIEAVTETMIWGNHSASQFPDYFHARINGQLATDMIADNAWFESQFLPTVQKRGATVIQARGTSSAASAANGVVDGLRALTGQFGDALFSMGVYSDGQYGAEAGLVVSYPCQYINGTLNVVDTIEHGALAMVHIEKSFAELKQERDLVDQMGLLTAK